MPISNLRIYYIDSVIISIFLDIAGKTSIVLRWDKGQHHELSSTIGVDYKAKIIPLNGELIKIQVIHS